MKFSSMLACMAYLFSTQLSAEEASFRPVKPGFSSKSPYPTLEDLPKMQKEIYSSYWYVTAGAMIVLPQATIGYHFQYFNRLANTIAFSTTSLLAYGIEVTQLVYLGKISNESSNGYIGVGVDGFLSATAGYGIGMIGGYRFIKDSHYNFIQAKIGGIKINDPFKNGPSRLPTLTVSYGWEF